MPVLGAIGVTTGVGMAGYGGYRAATAKTDGEAKQALETMGMGVTTIALSVAAADKALEQAAKAGVKSAHVSEDAGFVEKTVQMFKSIPESLTKSKESTMSYLKGTPVNIELANGTKQVKVKGKLVEEMLSNGTEKKYIDGKLNEEIIPGGGYKKYDASGTKIQAGEFSIGDKKVVYENGRIIEERFTNGSYKIYKSMGEEGLLEEGNSVTGDYQKYHHIAKRVIEEGNKITADYKKYGCQRSRIGGYNGVWELTDEGNIYSGDYKRYYQYDYDLYENGEFKGTFKKPTEIYNLFKELASKNNSNMKVTLLNDQPETVEAITELQQSPLSIIKANENLLDGIALKVRNNQSLSSDEINNLAKIMDIPSEKLINMDNTTYIELCKKYHPANSSRTLIYADKLFEIIQNL